MDPVIVVVYTLFLKYNMSAQDIWDLAINNRYKFETLVINCLRIQDMRVSVDELMSLPNKVFFFVTKYFKVFVEETQQNHNYAWDDKKAWEK